MNAPCTPDQWLNLCDYTPVQMALVIAGTLFWNVAYGIIARNGIRYQYVEMPSLAGSSNFAWELVWGFMIVTDMGELFVWGLRVWFFMDVFIFALLVYYGYKQFSSPLIRPYHKWIEIGVFLYWIPAFYFFYKEGYDTSMGATSAYLITVIMEAMFIGHFLSHPPGSVFSPVVGWCRLLGNTCMSVFVWLKYPDMLFLWLLTAAVFILDVAYVLIQAKHAAFNQNWVVTNPQPAASHLLN